MKLHLNFSFLCHIFHLMPLEKRSDNGPRGTNTVKNPLKYLGANIFTLEWGGDHRPLPLPSHHATSWQESPAFLSTLQQLVEKGV